MKSRIAFLISLSIFFLSSSPGNSQAQNIVHSAEVPLHPDITVYEPAAGDALVAGTVVEIKFLSWGKPDTLRYSADSGVTWNPIATLPPGTDVQSYNWTVPDENSANIYLYIVEAGGIGGGVGPFTITPAASAVSDPALPTQYSLNQNFPNPSTGLSSITYAVSAQAFVTLSVSDLLGNEVRRLESKTLSAGTYESLIDMGGLPNGTYIYTLHANDRILQGKMILDK